MSIRKKPAIIIGLVIIIVLFLAVAVADFLFIKNGGTPVAAPEIPRSTATIGSGPDLKLLIMGDSTSIGQGTDYKNSIAVAAAQELARHHTVHFKNVGISGDRTNDVAEKQLSAAMSYKPDVVLLAIGANDVTHFTKFSSVKSSLDMVLDGLINANCNVKIVLTASPAVGAVPRFPFPVRQIIAHRVGSINQVFEDVIASHQLTLAPIAKETGEIFLHNPSLFAADKFHPNTAGYAIWNPVITAAIRQAADNQPSHCKQ